MRQQRGIPTLAANGSWRRCRRLRAVRYSATTSPHIMHSCPDLTYCLYVITWKSVAFRSSRRLSVATTTPIGRTTTNSLPRRGQVHMDTLECLYSGDHAWRRLQSDSSIAHPILLIHLKSKLIALYAHILHTIYDERNPCTWTARCTCSCHT